MAVKESVAAWKKIYSFADSFSDIDSTVNLINLGQYGLTVNIDAIVVNDNKEVLQDTPGKEPLGLLKKCLGTATGDGSVFEVSAPTYQSLLSGIDRLAKRRDIVIGSISIAGDQKQPVARLGGFCVLTRTDE